MKNKEIGIVRFALYVWGLAVVFACWQPSAVVAQACCGDCNDNGTVSIGELQQAVNNFLGACHAGVCAPIGTSLAVSGQVTTYGSASDGSLQVGAPPSFVDNGNGTISDLNTRLIWEKKDDTAGIHGRNNLYTWGSTFPPYTMDGTIVTEFLNTLNTAPCFTGYCDWRIPNVRELQSLQYYEAAYPFAPSVDPIFHDPGGCSGCNDVTIDVCSCTRINGYWASTTYQGDPTRAYVVNFAFGSTGNVLKDTSFAVRAVRGGMGVI